MALQNISDAKHWRDRAAKMRVLSGEISDAEAQSIMVTLANEYDTLADRAEDRAKRDSAPAPSPIPKAKEQSF